MYVAVVIVACGFGGSQPQPLPPPATQMPLNAATRGNAPMRHLGALRANREAESPQRQCGLQPVALLR